MFSNSASEIEHAGTLLSIYFWRYITQTINLYCQLALVLNTFENLADVRQWWYQKIIPSLSTFGVNDCLAKVIPSLNQIIPPFLVYGTIRPDNKWHFNIFNKGNIYTK